jgi:UDP-glucose 4-epimerase
VYGNPLKLPVDEKQIPAPISPYGFHKLMCEQLAIEFHKIYGIPTTIVRIFSAYGAGLRRQVLWDICEKASSQKILRLQGPGNDSRDFVDISDVAQGMYLLIEKSQCQGDVYNLASGTETSIRTLQELVVDELGMDIKVEFDGLVVPGNPLNWRADMSRLSAMGFKPKVNLREGVGDFVWWYLTQENASG